ncbi:protein MARD1 [Iris pallida]|uniref:Protein MARD1 n=1 Tax=Iris pallida TaxID=29817 RepID=A0AAX6GM85_IRIPA|nr:protein MARD1 [Iris pallida]
MFDQFSLSSPKPPFPSSRVFICFSPKGFTDGTDAIAMSSTSILKTTKHFSPFFADRSLRKPALEPPQPVGLDIAEGLTAEPTRPVRTMAVTTGESSRKKARARTLPTEWWRPMRVNSREHLRIHGINFFGLLLFWYPNFLGLLLRSRYINNLRRHGSGT